MKDEDILKTVADELRRFGDFDNIDYLMPNLEQAIENILAKYDRALSDLVKAEKEKNELKEEKDNYQGLFIVTKENSISRDKIKEKIEKDAFEVHTREYGNIDVIAIDDLQELLGEEK